VSNARPLLSMIDTKSNIGRNTTDGLQLEPISDMSLLWTGIGSTERQLGQLTLH
jgi:hypothetical protein